MKSKGARQRKPPSRGKRWFFTFLKVMAASSLVFVPLGLGAGYAVVTQLTKDLPDVEGLASYEAPQTTRIFSKDGQVVATLFVENRTTVPLDRMSPYLPKALLAVEDSRFMQHHGVDWVGVGRAALANVFFRGIDQGASTLTMQLARNRFLTQDQTIARKIREIVLAQRIEKRFSKEKILEYYLNNVYFGSGAYGVAAASSLYFGKPAQQLSIAQSALIAGLVQAPSSLSPLVDAQAAVKRMKIVLARMKQTHIIDQKQYDQAVREGEGFKFSGGPMVNSGSDQLLKYPYFTTYVIAELSDRYPEDMLYRAGLQVRTTLDIELQRMAEDELAYALDELGANLNAGNAALVLIENSTGYVRAMVGGRRWSQENQFNRAWQAVRQPGSSFKPFVYTAALLQGMTPESAVEDNPVNYGGWSPKNSDGKFKGRMPMRQALQESRNAVAAWLINRVGSDRVVEVAHALGIHEQLTSNLTLALGSCEVAPISMASAYSTLASGGVYHPPLSVTQVVDHGGEILTDNRNHPGKRMLPADIASQMIEMMMGVVLYGTGTAAYIDGVDVAGKTGTTDDSRDAWFVGFTPEYTLAVWVGNDDHSAMYDVFGGGLPATIWRRVMGHVVARGIAQPRFAFEASQAQRVKICRESGFLATAGCPKTRELQVFSGPVPKTVCSLHAAPTPTPTPTPTPEVEETPAETPLPEETPLGETPLPVPPEEQPLEPLMTPVP
ncbi:MAG: PBP1A family penicillin-binding protein [Candidatus Eremiobacteraeota bacterium]|nr:PBP1A family penicillin-binding protein [Candidatus Eremiobacteraeota bacterium]MCW5870228.1 PBP1A family penicillin-binding protein [Candidatus Eremiobacteraeota bacterium]